MLNMNIAVLITCHNRKEKSLSCLRTLFVSRSCYNNNHELPITLKVFLVDDGCTDGTAEAVVKEFSRTEDIFIIKGSGELYWAGGMRAAWKCALKHKIDWDFFLLLNDDVVVYDSCLENLLESHNYSVTKYGKGGVYSGITCEIGNSEKTTYGGVRWISRIWGKAELLPPRDVPQLCDAANANIMLVSQQVVKEIGIFYEGYQHGYADYEYSMFVRKKGLPLFVAAHLCGECPDDHINLKERLVNMSISERRKLLSSPLYSIQQRLLFTRRNFPIRYPITLIGGLVRLYFPKYL